MTITISDDKSQVTVDGVEFVSPTSASVVETVVINGINYVPEVNPTL